MEKTSSFWWSFFTALRFLTILPVRYKASVDAQLFPQSIYFFPLIGLLIGCGGALVTWLLFPHFSQPLVAILVIGYLAGISGCLHLDGLADSGDGLLSNRSGEKALAIMKDSRSGAMGVAVMIFVLLGKYAALSSLTYVNFMVASCVMPLAGRCAILFTMALAPYARPEGGLGALFYGQNARRGAILALVFLGGVLIGINGWLLGVKVVGATILVVTLFTALCKSRIGGATGDTLGAVCELTELGVAFALAWSV